MWEADFIAFDSKVTSVWATVDTVEDSSERIALDTSWKHSHGVCDTQNTELKWSKNLRWNTLH